MNSAGALAISWTEPHTDSMPSSVNGRAGGSPEHHYKISQVVITQTRDFRWKVAVFSPTRCETVQTFSSPDRMWLWVNDVSRLHTWAQIEGVGL